jgi:cellobiose phosphorylase
VVTENSLGFSYFENSALGKLTPHTADAMCEDMGERLILRIYSMPGTYEYKDFDLCACSDKVDFCGGRAVFSGVADGIGYAVEICVEKEKCVKKVRVELEKGKVESETAIFFAVRPCLGERMMHESRYTFEHSGKCIFVSSVLENPLALALASSAENVSVFDDEAAMISDGRVYCGGGNIAVLCARNTANAEFFLAACTAEFGRAEFELFVQKGDFRPYTLPAMFEKIKFKTENELFDISVNFLFPYQIYYSRFLARAGFYQVGGAYGFRDQLQDSLSFIENAPWLCREQILRAAAHQYREGDVTHWWHSYAGKETGLRSRYSDDLLWLPFVLCEYFEKTNDIALLSERAPYLCSPMLDSHEKERYEELRYEEEGSVWEHALLAAELVYSRGFGEHGLLLFGGGDWNDGMNLVGARGKGESVWLTEFCSMVYLKLSRICNLLGETEKCSFFSQVAKKMYAGVVAAFGGKWYLRGYYDDGTPLGREGDDECEIDSLSQSFAVFLELEMFGCVSENTKKAINHAYEYLFDRENGIMKLLSPPFDAGAAKPGYIKGYIPGIRENGGQYTHAAVWAAMALLLAGETERGTEVLMAINPAVRSCETDFLQKYKIEPYVLAGDVYAGEGCTGRGGWSHYTGAAAWYRKAVLECVFGLHLCENGFYLEPNMSEIFDGAELSFDIRGTRYRVRYSFCKQSGAVFDGRIIASNEDEMKKYLFPLDKKEHLLDFCMIKMR